MKKSILRILLLVFFTNSLFAQYAIYENGGMNFIDISSSGTALNLSDDGEANITVPFTVYLGDSATTQLRIGNNGAILFDATSGNINANNGTLTPPTQMIAPFWDDFDSEMGNVYYKNVIVTIGGVYAGEFFVIQWDRVHYNGASNTDTASFEVIFNKFSKNIDFVYHDVDMDGTSYDYGASATIGICTAQEATTFSYNTASLNGISSLRFSQDVYVPDNNFEHYLETHTANGNVVSVGDENSLGDGNENNNYVPYKKVRDARILNIYDLNISDLTGIEYIYNLDYLDCRNNNISSINLSNNTELSTILCSTNNLTILDVSTLTNLEELKCSENNLHSLDLSNNTNLTKLYCHNNQLDSLDLSNNTLLEVLILNSNNISSLNLNNLTHLNRVSLINLNNLTTLYLQNGANNLLSGTYTVGSSSYPKFTARNCPNLSCIYVDNASDANQGINDYQDWEIDANTHFVENDQACESYHALSFIPDDNFEMYLETHTATGDSVTIGSIYSLGNGVIDDSVLTYKIQSIDTLNIIGQSIADLTGINNFTNITYLNCSNNNLTSANINLANLLHLNIGDNQYLTNIDISNCSSITVLEAYLLPNLTQLDVHNNITLEELHVSSSGIISINLDNNTHLSALSATNMTNLREIHIQNGANNLLAGTYTYMNFNMPRFTTLQTPNLTCIYVDNASDAEQGINDYQDWETDETNNFVETDEECNNYNALAYVPDDNFEMYLETHDKHGSSVAFGSYNSMGNGVIDDSVFIYKTQEVNTLNIIGQEITDLTGINSFTHLVHLNCANNNLNSVSLNLTWLSYLNIGNNTELTSVDISNCLNLTGLDAYNLTALSQINLQNNSNLESIDVTASGLVNLNLDNNNRINKLRAEGMPNLEEIHIQNGNNILLAGTYDISGSEFPRFKATGCPNLSCIYVDNASDATQGINDYQDWEVNATAHFVETDEECNTINSVDVANNVEANLYPNPTNNYFIIETNETILNVEVYNQLGELQNTINKSNKIDISKLKTGTYIVKITTITSTIVKRIIKQ